jgi:hypothetical protein
LNGSVQVAIYVLGERNSKKLLSVEIKKQTAKQNHTTKHDDNYRTFAHVLFVRFGGKIF